VKNLKFLIVEDEILLAIVLRKDLPRDGHYVCKIVGSGEDAIKAASDENPDVVLMDVI
jgi:two-component system, response regulator PdtaR